jgi:hypothetical protein
LLWLVPKGMWLVPKGMWLGPGCECCGRGSGEAERPRFGGPLDQPAAGTGTYTGGWITSITCAGACSTITDGGSSMMTSGSTTTTGCTLSPLSAAGGDARGTGAGRKATATCRTTASAPSAERTSRSVAAARRVAATISSTVSAVSGSVTCQYPVGTPHAAQGAKGIFVTLLNQPQVLRQSLRKGPLTLRRIHAGGRQGRCCGFPPSPSRTHRGNREPSAASLRYLPGIIAEVEGSLGVGPLVELGGGWGDTRQRETRHQDEEAELTSLIAELGAGWAVPLFCLHRYLGLWEAVVSMVWNTSPLERSLCEARRRSRFAANFSPLAVADCHSLRSRYCQVHTRCDVPKIVGEAGFRGTHCWAPLPREKTLCYLQ